MNQAAKKENLPAIAKEKVDLTGGIVPKDFDELNRFAELVNRAGLSPKSFDTPAKVAIGILTNMELGRPIITGLQDLAIINGKCGIYGDASLAMVTASGLMDKDYPIEEETGTPFADDWTFIFKVKRKGGSEKIGKWTWAESKRAGFDNPMQRDGKPDRYSPWRRFTRRMMQWKARNYVLRDTFGDILKGMKTVEDLHDMDGVVDLTETTNGKFEKPEAIEDLASKILETGESETKNQLESKLPFNLEGLPSRDETIDKNKDTVDENDKKIAAKKEQPSLNIEVRFETKIGKLANTDQMKNFLKVTAEKNNSSIEDVMKMAIKNPALFLAAFNNQFYGYAVDLIAEEAYELNPNSVNYRKNWINIKLPKNFIQYVKMHADEIEKAPDEIKTEMYEKFKRFKLNDSVWQEIFDSGIKNGEVVKEPNNISMRSDTGHTVEFSIVDTDEWKKLTQLQIEYPDIYREKIGAGIFKTVEDITEAINIIENAIEENKFEKGGDAK